MTSQYDLSKNEWDRLIDPETQKAYWYNNYTGESIWVDENENAVNDDRSNVEMEMINVPSSPVDTSSVINVQDKTVNHNNAVIVTGVINHYQAYHYIKIIRRYGVNHSDLEIATITFVIKTVQEFVQIGVVREKGKKNQH